MPRKAAVTPDIIELREAETILSNQGSIPKSYLYTILQYIVICFIILSVPYHCPMYLPRGMVKEPMKTNKYMIKMTIVRNTAIVTVVNIALKKAQTQLFPPTTSFQGLRPYKTLIHSLRQQRRRNWSN